MLSIILSVYSLLVFVISAALCIWLGTRRGVFNSALRLGCFLISGLIAFVIAKLLVNPIGNALSALIELPLAWASVQQLVVELLGGLAAPLVFMVLFFVIDKLSLFAYIPLKKKFADNEALHTVPHDKLFGALLGFVLAFCITLTCVMPVGYLCLANDTLAAVSASSLSESLPTDLAEPLDKVANAPVIKADYAVSGWLLRGTASDACGVVDTLTSLFGVLDALGNAEDASAVEAALQSLPAKTVSMVLSVAQDALAELLPEEAAPLADALSAVLSDIPKKLEGLSEEAYNRELKAIASVTAMLTNPDSAKGMDVLKTVLSSALLRESIVDNSEELKEALSDVTADMTKQEKKEIKTSVNEFADEYNLSRDEVTAILSIFGIQ